MRPRWLAVACVALALQLACASRGGSGGPREIGFANRAGWTRLGERWVEPSEGADPEVVEVGQVGSTFDRMVIAVEAGAVELFDLRIVFGDGSSYSPAHRLRFGRGARSRVLDLPGGSRVVQRVTFRHRDLSRGGRARIEFWAR